MSLKLYDFKLEKHSLTPPPAFSLVDSVHKNIRKTTSKRHT